MWEADGTVPHEISDTLGVPRDVAANLAELTRSQMNNNTLIDRDTQVALGLYMEGNDTWDLGTTMVRDMQGLSTTEEAESPTSPLSGKNELISVYEEVAMSVAMEEGTVEEYGAGVDITLSMYQSSTASAYPADGTPSAGPSRFPGALDYTLGWAQGDPIPSTTQSLYWSRDSVSRTIDPGLLWTEQNHIEMRYTSLLDDEDEEGNEDLEEGGNDEAYDDDASILHAEDEDNAPLVSNEDDSAIVDDDGVSIEVAANLPLFAPFLDRRTTRSQTHSLCENNGLTMPDASRGQKRRTDEDGEDDDDDEKAVKRARKRKAKDTGQKKQKTKPKAKRTTKAKARASSTKNKAKAGNTKSETKRHSDVRAKAPATSDAVVRGPGPSRFPGALSYSVGRVGRSATSSTTQSVREDRELVSLAIAPGLLYAEQEATTEEHTDPVHDDEDEEEDLNGYNNGVENNSESEDEGEGETSILQRVNDNNALLVSNEDQSAIYDDDDDDVSIGTAANFPLFAPPLDRPITHSKTRASCGNNGLTMPDASRGQKRRADEDGEDDDDDEKAMKRARKGKAKDTGQKKQKARAKAKRMTEAKGKAKASSTKNKAKAGNTKSEGERFPCLQAGCDQTFGRQSESSRHFRCSCPKRDPDDLEKPPCPHCKEPLCRGDSVRRHIEEGACPALKQSPGESKESGASSDGNDGKCKGGDKGGRGGGKGGRA
ncbi:predicted protein [Postia placenta Mad-698-R]|nr:predicted protein [Postia placenta Mad-698-R]